MNQNNWEPELWKLINVWARASRDGITLVVAGAGKEIVNLVLKIESRAYKRGGKDLIKKQLMLIADIDKEENETKRN